MKRRGHTLRRRYGCSTVAGSDAHRLAKMRALGVIWTPGRMPEHTPQMTREDEHKAERLFEGMSDTFVARMLARRQR
jgi:hypothetical protein